MAWGKSNAQTGRFTESPDYEKNRFKYGGQQGGAEAERANLAYRQKGVEERTGPQIDRTQSNESRGFQMGSLANLDAATKGQTEDMRLLTGAAQGNAPSRAEVLGQQMSDRALRAQTSAAGSVRGGPGAQAAAFRQNAQNAAAQRAEMNQGIQAERAAEMATARGQLSGAMGNARGQLAQASTATRGQDIGLATDQAKISQNQTALNDQRAAQYEQLQNKVASDQLAADVEQQKIASGYNQNANTLNTNTNQKNADRDWDLLKGIGGAASGAVGGLIGVLSDPSAKAPIMGSLATLGLGGEPSGSVDIGGAGGITGDMVNKASTGLTGSAMAPVGGGGVTGGAVNHGAGGGVALSDWRGKYTPSDMHGKGNVMLSPGEAKVPVSLDEAMGASGEARYDTAEEARTGFNGTPRGYANGRGAPEDDAGPSWLEPSKFKTGGKTPEGPDYSKMAPGQEDWDRHGANAKKEGDPDWKNGGATKAEAEAGPKKMPGWAAILSGGLGGFGKWAGGGRDVTTSDPAAKREAYEEGMRAGAIATHRQEGDLRDAAGKEGLSRSLGYLASPVPLSSIAGAAHLVASNEDADARDYHDERAAALEKEGRRRKPETTSPRKLEITAADPDVARRNLENAGKPREMKSFERGDGPIAMRSDEKAKEPARPAMDLKGGRDPQTFKRDTPADQKRVKKTYEDKAGKEADEMMAAMRASLGKGASVALDEGEIDQKFGTMSDRAMADAMRSMEASPYAYKEAMRPAEQTSGEVNVGPMANKMAHDPVARTAIVRDPGTGLLAIDKDKGLKVVMGSLASLQDQIDDVKNDVPRAVRAKKQRRRGDSAQP